MYWRITILEKSTINTTFGTITMTSSNKKERTSLRLKNICKRWKVCSGWRHFWWLFTCLLEMSSRRERLWRFWDIVWAFTLYFSLSCRIHRPGGKAICLSLSMNITTINTLSKFLVQPPIDGPFINSRTISRTFSGMYISKWPSHFLDWLIFL